MTYNSYKSKHHIIILITYHHTMEFYNNILFSFSPASHDIRVFSYTQLICEKLWARFVTVERVKPVTVRATFSYWSFRRGFLRCWCLCGLPGGRLCWRLCCGFLCWFFRWKRRLCRRICIPPCIKWQSWNENKQTNKQKQTIISILW